jgi:hypothetical protein
VLDIGEKMGFGFRLVTRRDFERKLVLGVGHTLVFFSAVQFTGILLVFGAVDRM